jgi:hypothetical protein
MDFARGNQEWEKDLRVRLDLVRGQYDEATRPETVMTEEDIFRDLGRP